MQELTGKNALVTGGALRLGKAISLALATAGANVVVHYQRSSEEAKRTAAQIRALGVKAWTIQCDLAQREASSSLISRVIEKAGPLDILINNASIFFEDRLETFSGDALDLNVQINAFAPLLLCRDFAAQGRPGAIVNMLDSRILAYDQAHAAYHLSKRMLFTLTKMSAIEFAPNVRVNGVSPGLVLPPPGEDDSYLERLKESVPLKRHGNGAQIADAVRFLLSNDFITGQVIYVDGGRHLKTAVYC